MLVHFRTRIRYPNNRIPFLLNQRPKLSQTLTLKMSTHQSTPKRPVCPSCSKPGTLCLCPRILNPGIENSVSVTILQHSLEKKHPLNSTRIATLGLKNLSVVTVSDVNLEARFVIRLLESDTDTGLGGKDMKCTGLCGGQVLENVKFDQVLENINVPNSGSGNVGNLEFERFLEYPKEENTKRNFNDVECIMRNVPKGVLNCRDQYEDAGKLDSSMSDDLVLEAECESAIEECIGAKGTGDLETTRNCNVKQSNLDMVSSHSMLNEAISDDTDGVINGDKPSLLDYYSVGALPGGIEVPAITATIGKYGFNCSLNYHWMPQTQWQNLNFDQLLASQAAVYDFANGFVVKKLQRGQFNGSMELEEYEEFELKIPHGSVLLFPSEKATGVEGLEATNFVVKNLIVLDGTWAKAKRMYNENPWLKLLPHLKLDPNKMSLYSEVRQQPKPGYLSTIESIVYALKAVGNNPEGLDNLLDVFASMVGDQRRCKDERLSKVSLL